MAFLIFYIKSSWVKSFEGNKVNLSSKDLGCFLMASRDNHQEGSSEKQKKQEKGKRRKEDHSSRQSKDRKDSSAKSSSHLNVNGASYAPPPTLLLDDVKDIGGVSGDLLEQNVQLLNQVSSNLAAFQLHDNTNMLSQARDNILAIMNDLDDMPEQMPPLPVKMNEEIANSILRPPIRKP